MLSRLCHLSSLYRRIREQKEAFLLLCDSQRKKQTRGSNIRNPRRRQNNENQVRAKRLILGQNATKVHESK